MKTRPVHARASALLGFLGAVFLAAHAHGALVVSGDAAGDPGDSVTIHIGLDAPLVADFDQFELQLAFDPDVLQPVSAAPGSLPGGTGFAANASAGLALISFPSTLASYAPGELASWTFTIRPDALPAVHTAVGATLVASLIDSPPSASLTSAEHAVTVVPEPGNAALLVAGIAMLGWAGRRGWGGAAK